MAWGDVLSVTVVVLAAGAATMYVAYVRWETRRIREEAARSPPWQDPLPEIARLNRELLSTMAESRKLLEKTRETVQRGTQG